MTSVRRLRATLDYVSDAIARNVGASATSAVGRTSAFWRDVFAERSNFPDLNEMLVFRRAGMAYGVGDDRQGSLANERAYSERMVRIFGRMVEREFIDALEESTFGAPLVFAHGGVERSASFWINAATTRRISHFVRKFGKKGPLRVLEIGAGWGACASQLHGLLPIDSYTIVDLPQNLHLSSVYLATVLSERTLQILDVAGPAVETIGQGTVVGCLPATIERLHAKFDLVVNSFSLQEMDLDTVGGYMAWIKNALAEDGIFVSLNSHGKSGVRKPSDYGYDAFHLHHWNVFRLSPSGFFNTIPYEVVVGPRRPDSPCVIPEVADGLGFLMQLGLDRNLDGVCDAMERGALANAQIDLMDGYRHFFTARSDTEREWALLRLEGQSAAPVWPYVRAHWALAMEDVPLCRHMLERACQNGLNGFARVRADVLLAGIARTPMRTGPDGFDPVSAYPEAAAIVSTGDLSAARHHVNRILAREV